MKSKIWTLDEAREILPEVIKLSSRAFEESQQIVSELEAQILPENVQELKESQLQAIISEWALMITKLGADVKGLWLVDFDNGVGYYCWKFGESEILYEHSYESGFSGRKPIAEQS